MVDSTQGTAVKEPKKPGAGCGVEIDAVLGYVNSTLETGEAKLLSMETCVVRQVLGEALGLFIRAAAP